MPEGYKPSWDVWSTYRHSPVEWLNPRVTNPRLLVWSGFATLPPAGDVSSAEVASPLCLAGGCALQGGGCLWSAWLAWTWCGRVPAGVSEGREGPREWCGVPIGTLPWSGLIRGLQTLGYSCGVASPLCLRRATCPLWGWLRHSASGGWRVCLWSGFTALRGGVTGVSVGVASPLWLAEWVLCLRKRKRNKTVTSLQRRRNTAVRPLHRESHIRAYYEKQYCIDCCAGGLLALPGRE